MPSRVLVVEDDLLNRVFFCAVLREGGYEVAEVADERSALSEAQEFQPDLILMDINLPHISGIEIIKSLKSSDALSKIPILAVTGYAGRGDEYLVREAGASGYLPKPVFMLQLLETAGDLINASREEIAGTRPV